MKPDLKTPPFSLNDEQIGWVTRTLAGMTEGDKLRQLFCLVLYNDDEETCRYLAEEVRPGGFMCRTMPAEQCARAVERMQRHARIPMLVAANLEAGGNGIAREGTPVCRPMQAAATGDPEYARRLGEVCGAEGAAVGANWAFAPIIDIDTNWRNPITNFRTFGSDPATVSDMGQAYVREIQLHGVAACIKHFPGDGCDERDQHVAPSVNSLSCEEWDATYGKVYSDCIAAGAMSVMVGHILQPAYTRRFAPDTADGDLLPASVNPALLTGLLRQKLGFNGLIITDSSAMAGISIALPRRDLVPMTIAAGCDMFLFTRNLEEDVAFMEEGFRRGVFTGERLDEAVTRILAMKAALGLPEKQRKGTLCPVPATAKAAFGNPVFRAWERDCADRAITLVKEEKGIFPVTPERFPRVLFCPLDKNGNNADEKSANGKLLAAFRAAGFGVTVFEAKRVTEGNLASVNEIASRYDLIVYAAMVRARYQPVARISWSDPQGANIPIYCHTVPTVFISLENPYHLIDVPQVRTYINCYAGSDAVIAALMKKLSGESRFTGVSPVDPFCGKWEAKASFGPRIDFAEIERRAEERIGKTGPVNALLFDLDGVLLSTDRFHYLAWKELADRLGIPFNEQDNEQFRGVSRMDCLEILLKNLPGRSFTEEEKIALATAKNDRYRELLGSLSPESVAEEVRTALAELRRRGYRMAVGSSSKNTRYILERVDLLSAFDGVADGNDIQRSKPDPEVFLKAAALLGADPAHCAVIEDAEAGLQAAINGGMLPVAIGSAVRSPLAALRLSAFSDLLGFFPGQKKTF